MAKMSADYKYCNVKSECEFQRWTRQPNFNDARVCVNSLLLSTGVIHYSKVVLHLKPLAGLVPPHYGSSSSISIISSRVALNH